MNDVRISGPCFGVVSRAALSGAPTRIVTRTPVFDCCRRISVREVAEHDGISIGGNVGHVHGFDHGTAKDGFELPRGDARLPEILTLDRPQREHKQRVAAM